MNESARSIPRRARADARRQQPGAAVGAVHVEPQPALRADVGDAGEVVDRAGVRRAGAGDHREHAVTAVGVERRRSAAPVSRPRSSGGTRARRRPSRGPRRRRSNARSRMRRTATAAGRPPRRAAAACRAATSAERLPAEPPETNTPPAPGGKPGEVGEPRAAPGSRPRSRRRRRASRAAIVEDAPTIRSNSTLAFVGAPGTNASDAGWSVEIVAGARTSAHRRSASSPPMPSGVIVGAGPRGQLLGGGTAPSRGCGVRDAVARVRDDRAPSAASVSSRELVRPRGLRATSRAPGRTPRTRPRTSGRRPRCAAPRSSTAPRRRAS